MTEHELGRGDLWVTTIGLGCMGMSEFYDPRQQNDEESVCVIHRYLDAGGNFLDTADVYGMGRNEILVGKAIKGRRDRVVLATVARVDRRFEGAKAQTIPSRGENVT